MGVVIVFQVAQVAVGHGGVLHGCSEAFPHHCCLGFGALFPENVQENIQGGITGRVDTNGQKVDQAPLALPQQCAADLLSGSIDYEPGQLFFGGGHIYPQRCFSQVWGAATS